jgi:cation transporter-like permease
MHHAAAIAASLASLGLVCAIYYCNILARPSSWLRSEMLAMILLSLLTGLFPLAVTAAIAGLWQALTGGISVIALVSAGADLAAVAAILASIWVFRALVEATYRIRVGPDNVTPLSPKPVNRNGGSPQRIAA